MKNVIFILSFFVIAFASPAIAHAQCNSDSYAEACISKLQDGFTFLKSFKIDGDGGSRSKVEYSYVFSKDTQYSINICADGSDTDGIVVTMYDANRKKVASNQVSGNFYPSIVYPCNATGIYYITFTFEGSSKHCGGSVLGFKR